MEYDVLIVGAGAAGLMAARILSGAGRQVAVLEARGKCGGRIQTIQGDFSNPVDAGAEFVHGNLPLTLSLLNEAGLEFYATDGELFQYRNGQLLRRRDFIEHAGELLQKIRSLKQDISVAELLNLFKGEKYESMKVSVQQYTEGYNAANIEKASAFALAEDWEGSEEEQYRIRSGYGPLVEYLENDCRQKGCAFYFNTAVDRVQFDTGVAANCGAIRYSAKNILITVPPVFLDGSKNAIRFDPPLPLVTAAAGEIGYGGVIKVLIELDHSFWETGEGRQADDMLFVFSDEPVPTWWSHKPESWPLLTGWLAGPGSEKYTGAGDEEVLRLALRSLSSIFDIHVDILQQYVKAHHVHNWNAEPYSRGGYSYTTLSSAAARKILAASAGNKIFFAGEALSEKHTGTVEGALASGEAAAKKILGGA